MYIEVFPGLGETLVSNTPGSAFRCTVQKTPFSQSQSDGVAQLDWLHTQAFPSKSKALFVNMDSGQEPLILRSDSNAEDLEG